MLKRFTADLHVHTCLSPCADVTMSPRKIVAAAGRSGLGIIAITDHNSAGNAGAVMRAAAGSLVTVLPGLEICTQEEVHILGLFGSLDAALTMQSLISPSLTEANAADLFGPQVLANEFDEVEGYDERLLIGATGMTLEDVVTAIHRLGGLAVASHIDRERNGLIGQLGFVPASLPLDAVEITGRLTSEAREALMRGGRQLPVIRNSDAHELEQLGVRRTVYVLEAPTLPELRMALRNEQGRSTQIGTA